MYPQLQQYPSPHQTSQLLSGLYSNLLLHPPQQLQPLPPLPVRYARQTPSSAAAMAGASHSCPDFKKRFQTKEMTAPRRYSIPGAFSQFICTDVDFVNRLVSKWSSRNPAVTTPWSRATKTTKKRTRRANGQ
ncbi:hypothetical protein BASA81_008088 [Batrachochytrium salamandrivorans]|nr:hypothetical protein BASA81_008088 [Batrachochytrium salamandrivorans]